MKAKEVGMFFLGFGIGAGIMLNIGGTAIEKVTNNLEEELYTCKQTRETAKEFFNECAIKNGEFRWSDGSFGCTFKEDLK